MYQYKCPRRKCKGFAEFQLTPARVQLLCPKCKTRQMVDKTPKCKTTKHKDKTSDAMYEKLEKERVKQELARPPFWIDLYIQAMLDKSFETTKTNEDEE